MKNALTADQWADINGPMFCYGTGADTSGRCFVYFAGDAGEGIHISRTARGDDPKDALFPVELPAEDRHALAAIALHEQSFGFTHQHLKDIDRVLDQAGGTGDYLRDVREVLTPIRDLIAALLPPDA